MDRFLRVKEENQKDKHQKIINMENQIQIIEVFYNDDLTIDILFNDQTRQKVDIGEFIRECPHPQYNKYLEIVNFKKGKLLNGNVVWGNDLEFHIEDLYNGNIM